MPMTFVLDVVGWSASGSGYRYTGPMGADGDAVKRVAAKARARPGQMCGVSPSTCGCVVP